LALAVILFISLIVLLRNERKITILWMFLFAGLLAFSTAAPLCSYLTDSSYPLPSAQTDYPQVCFEQQHSSINISVKPTSSLGINTNNFGTFFVWTQRLGGVPSLESTLLDATQKGKIIVIVNPTQPFTETDVHRLTAFFEKGGRVLLLDSIRNIQSTANDLLGSFGIWITTATNDQMVLFNESENRSQRNIGNMSSPYLTITGGSKLLTNEKNELTATMTEFKNITTGVTGKLVVAVDSYTFCDAVMGGVFTEPNQPQRRIYNTEFFLFKEILLS
jgi:hypothetical protein